VLEQPEMLSIVILLIRWRVIFDFINGFHDARTPSDGGLDPRAFSPRSRGLGGVLNFIAAFGAGVRSRIPWAGRHSLRHC